MKCYKIYTEDINRTDVLREANVRFPEGYTFFTGFGYWKAKQESSLIIEIISYPEGLTRVKSLARRIKWINNQDTILITETELSFSEFV